MRQTIQTEELLNIKKLMLAGSSDESLAFATPCLISLSTYSVLFIGL